MDDGRRAASALAAALLVWAAPLPAHAQGGAWEWHGDVAPIWWPFVALAVGVVVIVVLGWALLSVLPAVLAIIGAVLGIRWLARAADRSGEDRALAILRERYARGEITKDEFETRRRELARR